MFDGIDEDYDEVVPDQGAKSPTGKDAISAGVTELVDSVAQKNAQNANFAKLSPRQRVLNTIKAYFVAILEFFIRYLNNYSKDYREVSRKLYIEKNKIRQSEALISRNRLNNTPVEEPDSLNEHKPLAYRLFNSIYYLILSQSEILCYLLMILTHLRSASILSLPLPLSVFLWAMLCIPRPNKVYWITCITYTEAVVVIKYLFQFKLFPWNQLPVPPFEEKTMQTFTILGIYSKGNFASVDLLLLLGLFLHRSILKRLGLWRDSSADDEESRLKDMLDTTLSQPTSDIETTPLSGSPEKVVGVGVEVEESGEHEDILEADDNDNEKELRGFDDAIERETHDEDDMIDDFDEDEEHPQQSLRQ